MKSKKLLPFISLILILLLCCTGCMPATVDPVGEQYDINMRMNLEDVVVPETTGMYKFTQGFDDDLDIDALVKLVFGEDADVQREDYAHSVQYSCPDQLNTLRVTYSVDGFPYFTDGKQTAPLSAARNICMLDHDGRADYLESTEYNNASQVLYMYGFSAENGYIKVTSEIKKGSTFSVFLSKL